MKALVLESNRKLKYKDVSVPGIKDDECLIAVRKAGICNSDIARCYDNEARFYPLIMGHEIGGIVDRTGKDVKSIKKGDRVAVFPLIPCNKCEFCMAGDYFLCKDYDYYGSRRNGGFAEYLAVKEWNLFKIPKDTPLQEAALLEPLSVAIHAIRTLSFEKKTTLAILGAGLIGLTMAKYLSNFLDRKNIYVIDRNDFKLNIASGFGVKTINTHKKNWLENFKKETMGGVNYVIEVCGAVETYKYSLGMVKSHGDILWVGNIKGDLNLEKNIISSILRREIKIHGVWNSRYNHNKNDDWNYALRFIKSCRDLKKITLYNVPLSKGPEIFRELYLLNAKKSAKRYFIKVIFDIN